MIQARVGHSDTHRYLRVVNSVLVVAGIYLSLYDIGKYNEAITR